MTTKKSPSQPVRFFQYGSLLGPWLPDASGQGGLLGGAPLPGSRPSKSNVEPVSMSSSTTKPPPRKSEPPPQKFYQYGSLLDPWEPGIGTSYLEGPPVKNSWKTVSQVTAPLSDFVGGFDSFVGQTMEAGRHFGGYLPTNESRAMGRLLGRSSLVAQGLDEFARVQSDITDGMDRGRALAEAQGRMLFSGVLAGAGLLGGPFAPTLSFALPLAAKELGATDFVGRGWGDLAVWEAERAEEVGPHYYFNTYGNLQ